MPEELGGRPPDVHIDLHFRQRRIRWEFHAPDARIAQIARSIPGYLGEESWENRATGLLSNVYYWESLEALQTLMQHPEHLRAKQSCLARPEHRCARGEG